MIKIILSGASGRMGKAIASMVADMPEYTICAGIDIYTEQYGNFPIVDDPEKLEGEADVLIDFSGPVALLKVLPYAMSHKIPIVVATTGLGEEHHRLLQEAEKVIPVFTSANMSLGVSLLTELVKKAAALLYEGFDIEIIEKHHNKKLDAPSGTALAIADAISEALPLAPEYVYDRHSVRHAREKQEIGLHSVRGGTIVGEHSVLFAGQDELLEIRHTALSRNIFAVGAIRAAAFLKDKPCGRYSMQDLVNAQGK